MPSLASALALAVVAAAVAAAAAPGARAQVVKGWKPWEIGSIARERPQLEAAASYAALQWEEREMRQRLDAGAERVREQQQAPPRQQPRLAEQQQGAGESKPGWYHYMPPWWERPDTPGIPASDFAKVPELQGIAKPPKGMMPYFNPFDHIMLELGSRRQHRPHPLEHAGGDNDGAA